MTGNIQNESSHNSYLDAAISYGIPGAVFYIALIASSLALLLRARGQSPGNQSILLTGVISAFVAVIVHKLFIFDQISTGLYFFAFAALAVSASNFARSKAPNPINQEDKPGSRFGSAAAAALAVGVALVGAAIWYSASLLNADLEIRRALEFASAADYEGVLEHGKRAADAPDPSGGYDFLFARALADCADNIQRAANAARDGSLGKLSRASAIDMAIAHAERSTRHGISPDSSYVLLCYLASQKEDYAALQKYAKEAIKWDSLYASSHSFLAEADLAAGDIDGARREISIWLGLIGRDSGDARRAKRIWEFIESGSALADKGNYIKARVEMIKGSIAAADACSECHIALAAVYEKHGFFDDAIQEWQRLIEYDPARAGSEGAQSRVASLKQKLPAGTTR
jgi:tetratricopeptide (TPR) repeat protein